MKIKTIRIQNYRSIEDCTIEFKHDCEILIGKNEAGKTNILSAIDKGLNPKSNFSCKDIRKRTTKEHKPIEAITETFNFAVEESDLSSLYYCHDKSEDKTILNSFLDLFNYYNYVVSFDMSKGITEKKVFVKRGSEFDNKIQSLSNRLFWNSKPFTDEKKIQIPSIFLSKKFATTFKSLAEENLNSGIEEMQDFVNSKITDFIVQLFARKGRSCIFWKYSSDYLLKDSYSISEIEDNPPLPLKNIFLLAGYDDIPKAFTQTMQSDGNYENLYETVSQIASRKFLEIWPDLKDVNLVLSSNGFDSFLVGIKEGVRYSFADRSDGFKRFISILLTISSEYSAGVLKDYLILVDEPDASLYPSGARSLMKEFLKLSKDNQVVYATHCPFMIDTDNIDRHIIVKKKNERTSTKVPKETQFDADEVLLNAIGASVYESSLKQKNVIFEGPLDRLVFKKWCKSKQIDLSFGVTCAHGVSSIPIIVSQLELVNKKYLIISDCDEAGIQAFQQIKVSDPIAAKNWTTYKSFEIGNQILCLEDFYKLEYVRKICSEEQLPITLDQTNRIWSVLKSSLPKDELQHFKSVLAEKACDDDLKSEYGCFVDYLIEVLNGKKKLANAN